MNYMDRKTMGRFGIKSSVKGGLEKVAYLLCVNTH